MSKLADSFNKNKVGILFILVASLLTALGQLFWKISDGHFNVFLIAGFFLYFCGAVFMIVAFRFGSLSVIHPFLSIGYVFSVFFGVFFLGEVVPLSGILGICLILLGAIAIGGGDN
jgi:drug/metabolite transporter (DMT)-like permease